MVNILVTAASKYGSTREIAQFITKVLNEQGHTAIFKEIDEAREVPAYDAVIIGSAVYAGKWLKSARQFIHSNTADLQSMPVWLFSSGSISEQPPNQEQTVIVTDLMEKSGAIEHMAFAGKLEKSRLSLLEKAAVRLINAREGDFRDWGEITAWSIAIANTLKQEVKL